MKIFHNGVFLSCGEPNEVFSILIEDQGKIHYTGNTLPTVYDPIKERVDLQGRCVLPAFIDTHLHFESFALFNATLDVRDAVNFGELSHAIRNYALRNPADKVILGFGCSAHTVSEGRLPDREFLDTVTSKPLLLVKYDGHAAMANSALIRRLPRSVCSCAGYDEKNGWFRQQAFYDAVNHVSKSVSIFKIMKNLIGGADVLAERGIAMAHTSEGVGFPLDADVDVMRFAARGLPLSFRIYFQTMDLAKVLRRKLCQVGGCFATALDQVGGCFATALDGCFGSEDAALKAPYSHDPLNSGVLFYSQPVVNHFVCKANRSGLQVALHAIGDAAVEQAIKAFEAAFTDFPRQDHRHIIIHADLIPAPLLERAARLELHMAVQTPFLYWKQEPMSYLQRILGDRAGTLIPLRSMLAHGLTIAGGSDAPCTLPNPMMGVHAACNHPNPDERISVMDALRMHTAWAARFSFDEEDRGTLQKRKSADFVVLDRNPLSIPEDTLKQTKVVRLYVGGKLYSSAMRSPKDLLFASIQDIITGDRR